MVNHVHTDAKLAISTVDDNAAYLAYLASTQTGIGIVAEPYGETPLALKADGIDFAKWVRQTHPELPIALPKSTPKIALHSADVWLPLIYLASDTSVSIFLNMVASYLYDKAKGKLPSDRPKVQISVMYQNKREGTIKKFDFSGDSDSLKSAIKRFDINNFFDENS